MKDIEKYYEITKNTPPHPLVKELMKMKITPQNAIDLGCGSGKDTVFLIKNGWNVLAIDQENTKDMIEQELTEIERKKFRFKIQKFEEVELEKNDLLVANFSIPFCNKNYFEEFWKKITNSILEKGYFIGNFFGEHDSWNGIKENMVFLSKEQVLNLFEKEFKIVEYHEIEKDGNVGLGKRKHWHIYNIMAQKI